MSINIENFLTSLNVMALGMGGIFVVIIVIYILMVILNKIFSDKTNKKMK